MSEKTKVFVIADHPNAPSGVGIQTKYFIEALLKTGRYKVFCFGGAIKHPDYRPQTVKPYEEDFVIFRSMDTEIKKWLDLRYGRKSQIFFGL